MPAAPGTVTASLPARPSVVGEQLANSGQAGANVAESGPQRIDGGTDFGTFRPESLPIPSPVTVPVTVPYAVPVPLPVTVPADLADALADDGALGRALALARDFAGEHEGDDHAGLVAKLSLIVWGYVLLADLPMRPDSVEDDSVDSRTAETSALRVARIVLEPAEEERIAFEPVWESSNRQ